MIVFLQPMNSESRKKVSHSGLGLMTSFFQWDLGFYSKDHLPTSRGFDTFYGSYLQYGDYMNHTTPDKVSNRM